MSRRPSLPLLLRAGLRHHAAAPLQSALALAGIALGVALFMAVRGSLNSAEAAFEGAAAALAGNTTHVLRGGPDGVPVGALATLQRELGVRAAAPVVTAIARPAAPPRRILRVFGCDPLAEGPLRAFAGFERAGGTDDANGGSGQRLPLGPLLTVPGAFVATPATLERLHVAVGGDLDLRVLGRQHRARCVGALFGGAALDDVLVVDVATAQEWRGTRALVDRVDLRLEPEWLGGGSADAAAARIAAALGPALTVEPAPGRSAFERLTRAFRVNLQALSLLSLLVSAFLVHATMRVAVLARRETFAVLRALGATRRTLLLATAAEALLLGGLGALLGAGLGFAGAHVLLAPVVRTLNDHWATFDVHGVAIAPADLLLAVVLGAAVAVVAALGPARDAAAVPPREVLVRAPTGDTAAPRAASRRWPWLAAPAGAVLLWAAGPRIELAYAGLLLVLLAAAAAVPPCMHLVLRCVARVGVPRSPWLHHVVRGTDASRHRTGIAVAALALALGTTIGLGMLVASFRGSVQQWLQQALPADVYVHVPGGVDERTQAVLAPATVAAIRAVPGVAAVSTYRRVLLPLLPDAPPVETTAWGPSPRLLAALPFVASKTGAREAFANGDGVFVSEPLAFQRGLRVGDTVAVPGANGPEPLRVLAVFRDYGSARGVAMVPAARVGGGIGALALDAAPGVAADELAERVRTAVATAPDDVLVTTQATMRADSLRVFDRTFAVTAALRLFVVLVAALGIYGAFAALQLERAGEIGLLRALGALPRRVRALVFGQTALLGLCAGLFALPIGVVLGLVMVHVLNRGSFGWTLLDVHLPVAVVVEALGLAAGAALLAGVQPARRFVRVQPAAALREL